MKIIVSHDVDHLYVSDHLFKDLIIEKLIARSLIYCFQNRISMNTCFNRIKSIFNNQMTKMPELIKFDRSNNIPSTFFFGMDNILGMSYSKKKAKYWIEYVKNNGFDVGVHGVEIEDILKIKKEYSDFANISESEKFGIRTHYVRYNSNTFNKFAKCGYLFDTSEFDKCKPLLKEPYKVESMWEFPLCIMDGYICKEGEYDKGFQNTLNTISMAENKNVKYLTVLFHDYLFDSMIYPDLYKWYCNLIIYLKNKYEFISYKEAINELEINNDTGK